MGTRLSGKGAIVTGGAGGIGRAIVAAFVDEGASVLFVDVDQEAGTAYERELTAAGHTARFLRADISEKSAAAEIVEAAVETCGRLDVLVNNAHASRQVPLMETTEEILALSMDTGFYATFHLMQAAHAQLKANAGAVINFASGSGLRGMPLQASYAAAKEAIRGLSRVAAHEWAADGIRVNIVSPLAATEGVQNWMDSFPEVAAKTLKNVPLGRFGDPRTDIAPVVVFLASDESQYITGQTVMADGGSIMLR